MKWRWVLVKGSVMSGVAILLFLAGCGSHSTSTDFATNSSGGANPVPAITAISPTNAFAGNATGFVLTVNGTNFITGSAISFGGTTFTTTFVSSTQLTATVSAAAIASAGTVAVMVTNPPPSAGTSNMVYFTVNGVTNPIPAISFLDPGCVPAGAQTFALAVSGTNFAPGSVIRWNGTDLPTTINGGPLMANIPANDVATAGTAAVTVFNPAPGGGVSSAATFNIAPGGVGPTSLAVDPTGKFAYVANEGCPDTFYGSVSMYTINPADGTLTSAGPPVTSGDFGADAVAVDPSGKFTYVANSGEGDTAGSVSAYALNGVTGTLTLTGTIPAPCMSGPGACAPWSLAVHPAGQFVYVANEGGFSPTTVSAYAIDVTTGVLRLIGTIATDGRAASVTVDPSGKFAYVANGGQNSGGSNGTYVSMYSIDATTGALTWIGKIAAGLSPSSIAVHPSGKFVYAVNYISNDISTYTLNPTTGDLEPIGTLTAGPGPIVIHPSGKFAYVATSGGIAMYGIDAATGTLTFAGITASGSTPSSITIHPSGKFVYGTNYVSNSISIYSIDSSAGSLTLIGTIGT